MAGMEKRSRACSVAFLIFSLDTVKWDPCIPCLLVVGRSVMSPKEQAVKSIQAAQENQPAHLVPPRSSLAAAAADLPNLFFPTTRYSLMRMGSKE